MGGQIYGEWIRRHIRTDENRENREEGTMPWWAWILAAVAVVFILKTM